MTWLDRYSAPTGPARLRPPLQPSPPAPGATPGRAKTHVGATASRDGPPPRRPRWDHPRVRTRCLTPAQALAGQNCRPGSSGTTPERLPVPNNGAACHRNGPKPSAGTVQDPKTSFWTPHGTREVPNVPGRALHNGRRTAAPGPAGAPGVPALPSPCSQPTALLLAFTTRRAP